MMRIAVLGSTGSIGRQTLEIISAFPDRFKVVALAGGLNAPIIEEQVRRFRPRFVSSLVPVDLFPGVELATLEQMSAHPDVDLVVVATSGKSGLSPTLAALKAGKSVALSNKEVLVMAGEIVMGSITRESQLLPVDSEHSAIWQCIQGEPTPPLRLWITASGGPFYGYTPERLAQVTAEEALRHPVWKMGKKVTIDSSTLMNKGLEVIEAHWLFNIPYERIDVLVHPQSIVHSMVLYRDNSVKAQLSSPDMRLPIQYALTYPERIENQSLPLLDLCQVKALTFMPVDQVRFRCLALAREAGMKGGTYPVVLSAADEVAVELFLTGRIGFSDIPRIVESALEAHKVVDKPSLEDIIEVDTQTRKLALQLSAGVKR
jgi:1-deoxy-D-xylulose-5-phosphate reductoisomerase